MSRSVRSACSSPFWSIASTADRSASTRAATIRSALVVLPAPVPPQEKMCCPSLRGQPRPVELAGHRHVRLGVRPWALADDLALRADVDALARSPSSARVATPSAARVRSRAAPRQRRGRPAASDASKHAGRRRGGQRSDRRADASHHAEKHGDPHTSATPRRRDRGCESKRRSSPHQPSGGTPSAAQIQNATRLAASAIMPGPSRVVSRIASSSSIRVAFAGRPASRLNSRTLSARCWFRRRRRRRRSGTHPASSGTATGSRQDVSCLALQLDLDRNLARQGSRASGRGGGSAGASRSGSATRACPSVRDRRGPRADRASRRADGQPSRGPRAGAVVGPPGSGMERQLH